MDKIYSLRSLIYFTCLLSGFLLASAPACWAGGSPSPDNCKKLGTIEAKCHECTTGDYLGAVVVDAEYTSEQNSCMKNYKDARTRCAAAANLPESQVGISWEYSLGVTKYSGHYPSHCQH